MWRGHKDDRGPGAFSAALPADPSSVAKARHAIARFGERYGASPAKIAVAVSEAVANAVTHGSSREPDEPVYIEASVDGPAVVVRVHDRGVGMRPKPTSPGLGLGIPILGHLADQVAIDSSETGVSVELRFKRQASDPSRFGGAGRRGGHASRPTGGLAAQM
jgi:serine/threonine-protein kinase RsbW/stage II sporulation protein AB (anti-sigma F factor)